MRNCKECNTEIGPGKQYCSECLISARKQRQRDRARAVRGELKCVVCGVSLHDIDVPNKKYCSNACRPRNYYNKVSVERENCKLGTKQFDKRHEDRLVKKRLDSDKKKYKGSVDPKWLTRGKITNTSRGSSMEGSFTY